MFFIFTLLITFVAFVTWNRSRKSGANERGIGARSASGIAGFLMFIFGALAIVQAFTVIPAGHVGVVNFFGTVSEGTLKSGINFVNPLAEVIKMSIQTQEIKEVMAAAQLRRRAGGRRTIVFVDEIHRFNKAQQDAFLPRVEAGDIVLIGATTENPSFEVNSALLSRSQVFVLKPLSLEATGEILRRALEDRERGLVADSIQEIEGIPVSQWETPGEFDKLTPLFPNRRIFLEAAEDPSISAASSNSIGMVRKNCLSRKMKNELPNQAGRIRGTNVLTISSRDHMMNVGTSVTKPGSISTLRRM